MTDKAEFDLDFKPKYFLRCHSKQRKDAADVQTQVWQCAFEPTEPGKPAKIAATCGGNTVCCINVDTGRVEKKFYASNSKENFLALAWTSIDGKKILAAGGSVQTVNLMLYNEAFCFHEEKFDRNIMNAKCGITSLLFHPTEEGLLFCSCSDGKILALEIGELVEPNYATALTVVHKYQVKCEVFLLIYYQPWEILLGTSDDGIYCWNGSSSYVSSGKARNTSVLLQFLGRPMALTESPSLVDTAEILENGLVASKCALHGAIYIWNLETALGQKEFPKEEKNIRITPLYQLKWSDTDNYFMYLGYDQESKWLACGDDQGALWLYDINEIMCGKEKRKGMIDPSTILEWPNLEDQFSNRKRKLNIGVYDIVINKVILNRNSKHLVAVTNNNMVCVWKRH